MRAASALLIRVVATVCEGVVHSKLGAGEDNLCFCLLYDRDMNEVSTLALDGGGGSEIGGLLESGYEFGPAVRIAAVVGRVDADEDVERTEHLGPGECIAQEYRIAGGHVCERYLPQLGQIGSVLGHVHSRVGQGRASEPSQVNINYTVLCNANGLSHSPGRFDFT